jgi:glycosyltransferase involved in cell wall biosynthesis
LPNGLDLNEYRPNERDRVLVRTELGLNASLFAVGMIARVDPQKDYATFLTAVDMLTAKYPHIRFILVGRNTDKLPAVASVTALGERHDIPRLLRGLDAFVLSSAYGEGTPNVLAEAMASGLACITTNVGDAAVLVENSGIVISPQNPDELAAAIEALVCEAQQTRELRGQLAREIIQQRYNIEHATNTYYELCDKALHTNRGMQAASPGVAA